MKQPIIELGVAVNSLKELIERLHTFVESEQLNALAFDFDSYLMRLQLILAELRVQKSILATF